MAEVLFDWAAIAWVVVTTWQHRTSWKALGLRAAPAWCVRSGLLGRQRYWRAWHLYLADREHTLHRLHGPTPLLSHAWVYLIWAVMQQFLLQIDLLLCLQRMLPGKVAPVVAAAGLFSARSFTQPNIDAGHAGVACPSPPACCFRATPEISMPRELPTESWGFVSQ